MIQQQALDAAAQGYRVFPVWGLSEGACACPEGPSCESPGKHPKVRKWREVATSDPAKVEAFDWRSANYGIATDGLVVVDIDPRNGGDETWAWIEEQLASDGESWTLHTRTVKSGSGGRHLYYRGSRRSSVGLWEGIDVKGAGGYVLGPGSSHISGGKYELVLDTAPISVPSWVAGSTPRNSVEVDPSAQQQIAKGGRDNYLTQIAGVLRRRGFSQQEIEAALQVRNSTHCVPPLPAADVQRIAESVSRYAPDEFSLQREIGQAVNSDAVQARLLDVADVLAMPPPSWEIEHVWPEGGVNVLYGSPGSGKSFLALDWSLSRALGADWLGHKVTRSTKTLYVAAEGAFGFGARVGAWLAHRGHSPEALGQNWHLYPAAFNLLNVEQTHTLWELISRGDYGLVVIDTLRKSMTGGDENSTRDVGQLMSTLDTFSTDGGCDTLLVHHTTKGGPDTPKRYRGASAIEGDAYNMFSLQRNSGAGFTARLASHKFKDAPDMQGTLTFEQVEHSLVPSSFASAAGDAELAAALTAKVNSPSGP